MPHFIVEYTDNIKEEVDLSSLLEKVHDVLIERREIFPVGGLRSRAIELKDYRVADGTEDDAFVHAMFKIGAGRPYEVKKEACDVLFEVIKAHFADLVEKRYLALSMELVEFDEKLNYRQNNIHKRFKK